VIVKGNGCKLGPEDGNDPELPGWTLLSDLLRQASRLFQNILFLEGCELSSNTYLIFGEFLSLIDPGNDYTAFSRLFKCPEFAPQDIRRIVLTHGHPAHANATMELFRYPSIRKNFGLEVIVHEACSPELKRAIGRLGAAVTEVRGGEMLDLEGSRWEVIHTPGHSPDGICLYNGSTKSLLSGDMVPTHGTPLPEKQAGGRVDHYLASMRSLVRKEIVNVLPGHGGPVAANGKKVIEAGYLGVLNRFLGSGPEHAPTWLSTASAAARGRLEDDALFCCDRAMAEDPNDPGPLKFKAFYLSDLGDFKRSMEAFLLLEKNFPRERIDPLTITGKGHARLALSRNESSLYCY